MNQNVEMHGLASMRQPRGFRYGLARVAATCAMGSWLLLGLVPVVVVISALV